MRASRVVACLLATALAVVVALPASADPIDPGERSNLVATLQRQLAERGLYRGPLDGIYGQMTSQAVMAFHKHLGLERSFSWQPADWEYLEDFEPVEHRGSPGLVVDLDRQVLYFHRAEGEVAIVPVSSGNGEQFRNGSGRLVTARTPQGEFSLRRHIPRMRTSYLGSLWKPWYFYGGYAIHGSSSVPAHPASHGCIRVPNWEADWLSLELSLGMSLTVMRSGDVEPPPTPEPPRRIDRDLLMSTVE